MRPLAFPSLQRQPAGAYWLAYVVYPFGTRHAVFATARLKPMLRTLHPRLRFALAVQTCLRQSEPVWPSGKALGW